MIDRTAEWTKAECQVVIVYSIAAIILIYHVYFDWAPYLLHRLTLYFERRSVLQALSEEITHDESQEQDQGQSLISKEKSSYLRIDSSVGEQAVQIPTYRLRIKHPQRNGTSISDSLDHHSRLPAVTNDSVVFNPPQFRIKAKTIHDDAIEQSQRSSGERWRCGLNTNSIEARLHRSIAHERAWNNTSYGLQDVVDHNSTLRWSDNFNVDTSASTYHDHPSNTAIRSEQDREYQTSIEEDERRRLAKLTLLVQ